MSEEIKSTTGAESGEGTGEAQGGPKKKKKINKLTASELLKKIGEYESNNQIKCLYYKHLVTRKKELKV